MLFVTPSLQGQHSSYNFFHNSNPATRGSASQGLRTKNKLYVWKKTKTLRAGTGWNHGNQFRLGTMTSNPVFFSPSPPSTPHQKPVHEISNLIEWSPLFHQIRGYVHQKSSSFYIIIKILMLMIPLIRNIITTCRWAEEVHKFSKSKKNSLSYTYIHNYVDM